MDPHSPDKLIAHVTKYCFLMIVGDDTSFVFFLYLFFVFMLCCVVLCYVILILLILLIFTEYILLVLFYVSLIFL